MTIAGIGSIAATAIVAGYPRLCNALRPCSMISRQPAMSQRLAWICSVPAAAPQEGTSRAFGRFGDSRCVPQPGSEPAVKALWTKVKLRSSEGRRRNAAGWRINLPTGRRVPPCLRWRLNTKLKPPRWNALQRRAPKSRNFVARGCLEYDCRSISASWQRSRRSPL
jgi:hypothetical protein